MLFVLDHERATDTAEIERLLNSAFGADRTRLTSYRFREDVAPLATLGFVARAGQRILGSVRCWPIGMRADNAPPDAACLLGPLAVAPHLRGAGIGTALLRRSLAAVDEDYPGMPVFLIGDAPYYARVGFRQVLPALVRLPGPVAADRLLVRLPAGQQPSVMPANFALEPVLAAVARDKQQRFAGYRHL